MLSVFVVVTLCIRCMSASDNKVSQNALNPSESYVKSVWHNRLYLYSAAALFFGIWFSLKVALKQNKSSKAVKLSDHSDRDTSAARVSGVKIFYGSQTGTAKGFAEELSEEVETLGVPVKVIDIRDYDPDDQLADECTNKSVCVFLVATYTDGQPTENAEWFCKWLEEASTDFRYGQTYLKGLHYAVFGLGNSVYVGHYNTVGTNVDKWLWKLSAMRIMTRGEGDCNVVKSRHGSIQADFLAWKAKFLIRLQTLVKDEKKSCSGNCKTESSCKNQEEEEEEEEEMTALQNSSEEELLESSSDEESGLQDENTSGSVVDMEDLGNIMSSAKRSKYYKKELLLIRTELTARARLARVRPLDDDGDSRLQAADGSSFPHFNPQANNWVNTS